MSPTHFLPTDGLSGQELLLMLEMCLDAEERCALRSRTASENGDHVAAATAAKLGATYTDLKYRLFKAMKDAGTSTDDVQQTLQQLRRDLTGLPDVDKPDLPRL